MITGKIDCQTGKISVDNDFYPLHLYKVRAEHPEIAPEPGEFLAPSPLVAAFLFAPNGYTHKTVVVELLNEKPAPEDFSHDMLEAFIREHFVFGSEFYKKKPIREVFAHIENCMHDATVSPLPHTFGEPAKTTPPKPAPSPELEM